MSEWDMPTYPTMALRDEAGWQPVGGAFVASAAVHAFAIALIATMLVHAPAAATIRAERPPLQAVLVSPPRNVPEPVTVRAAPRPAPARAPVATAIPVQAPWTAEPFDPSPPQWLHSRPMISEGVVMFEMRNVSMLGETIERMIQANYAGEPQFPVLLKPVEELGYPLDVLEAGVEGRVLVWFGVDEEGKVVDREALDGPPELAAWVIARLDRLVDKPARNGDTPVRAWVALDIEFSRDAARTARELRAAEEERLDRAALRAKAREGSAATP
jgi:hypothetical protein